MKAKSVETCDRPVADRARTGATLTSVTLIVIAAVPLRAGVPLSVARMVTGKVPGPCASVGVQLNAPVPAPIVAPAGAPASSDHVIVFAGRSASVAVTVKASVVSSATVRFPGLVTTGATFTSVTVTVIDSLSNRCRRPVVRHANRDRERCPDPALPSASS